MELPTILGIIAGTITTTSFVPQFLKAYRTKHTKDISVYMFSMLFIGISLWLIYGLIKQDLPIILANGISLVFVTAILLLKFKLG
ncbi:MAG: SemiSWEET transporter [Deltaproteobacteria bacterium]|nr:SemiSWEET transporter [Deltaproteobacteria bacterium]